MVDEKGGRHAAVSRQQSTDDDIGAVAVGASAGVGPAQRSLNWLMQPMKRGRVERTPPRSGRENTRTGTGRRREEIIRSYESSVQDIFYTFE